MFWPLSQLNRIEQKIDSLLSGDKKMAADLTGLTASINNLVLEVTTAVADLEALSAAIAKLAAQTTVDPAALAALQAQADAATQKLTAAVAANQPPAGP